MFQFPTDAEPVSLETIPTINGDVNADPITQWRRHYTDNITQKLQFLTEKTGKTGGFKSLHWVAFLNA